MSSNAVFVLVEGKGVDPFFYSRLLRPVAEAAALQCDILRADFVTGAGGKRTLLELHRYLESSNALTLQVENATKYCIFYLDKDVDDVTGNLIRSKHVVYTPFYCIENHLFVYGELVNAAAAASSLDPEDIRARIPDSNAWRREKAQNWKEFLILSLLSHRLGVNCDCHYGRPTSPLNVPSESPTNAARADQISGELSALSQLPQRLFDLKLRALRRYIECLFAKDLFDRVFNGKWYFELIRREINLAAGGKRHNNPPTLAIAAALSASIPFEGVWTEHFRRPLRELLGAQGD
jgi:hypothetical protein